MYYNQEKLCLFREVFLRDVKKEVEERNCIAGCGLRLEGCQHWNNFAIEEAAVKFQDFHL